MSVFISHSHEDEGAYTALCLALDGQNVPRWDVSDMVPGSSLAEQLRNAINECAACILVATSRSLNSRWCLAEVGAFWGAGKPVILYKVDPEITEADHPPQFQGNLWTSDAGRVVERVRRIVSGDSIRDMAPPFDYRWLKAERDARDQGLFRQAQDNSTKAQYVVIRGRSLLSGNGDLASIQSNEKLSHLNVQVLMLDIASLEDHEFMRLKKQMDLNWGDPSSERDGARKRVEFLQRLSQRLRLEYRLLPSYLVPEIKMQLYDNWGYFSFYRQPGRASGPPNRPVFCVTSSPLLANLKTVFNRLWLEGKS